ncbi:MAG: hypothetical protein ABSG49_07025 [Methanoregula sp.]|jgi:hypothetical protein|uniref:hypothetical protein n=1 Tax=Methanoregula sp. TaxID=2052170 RepID=UPI003C157CF9
MISTREQVQCTVNQDNRHPDRIRVKFQEVFGRECTMRDDALLQKYTITVDGDLIMYVR